MPFSYFVIHRESTRFRLLRLFAFGCLSVALCGPPLLAQSVSTPSGRPGGTLAGTSLQAPPADFDVQARSRQVMAHLSAVIRYYRASLTPIQKVGEPSDALYRDEAVSNAKQVANLAFLSGRGEATLLSAYAKRAGAPEQPSAEGEAEKLQAAQSRVAKRIEDLKTQQRAIADQLQHARGKAAQALRAEQGQVEGQLELSAAMSDALDKIVGMSDTRGQTGLAGDVDRLERTAPELTDSKTKVVPVTLESFSSASSAGVSSQAAVLFQLLSTRNAIDRSIADEEALHTQALDLRTPLTKIVRSLMQKGQELSQQQPVSPAATNAPGNAAGKVVGNAAGSTVGNAVTSTTNSTASPGQTREIFDSVTSTFKALSTAAVPLSQEIITLEQGRSNLIAWREAVQTEYLSVLRSLLLRMLVIAIALGVLLGVGEVWRRVTTRYVHDLRRRRQLLGMRKIVIGVLSALVVLFGFVTQFNSLATFAGFITAGLAVGLQTILLSVAAYFFIVGRYGVRVGDRITVAGVTGDVIEVGLVRFYVMELAGSGTELQSTGRVAVFSNAILFQAGTPLYKQLPGTEYAWHEMTAKLEATADYRKASAAVLASIEKVYDGYRSRIEQQQRSVEGWMNARIGAPIVESRLLLVENGLQLLVRFPVEIRKASGIDQQVTEAVLRLMQEDESVKQAVTGPPAIKAAVKG
jgi:small-conductance mechanosensitive channel